MIVPQTKNGILNIDKPQCITSHDVVDAIRKIFPDQKVGHTGTLDPLATGVLPICIGEATKLSDKLISESKKYSVKMLLGVETDTYDITGRIVFASIVNKDEIYIKERIKRFIGKQQQLPPKYSAIKVEGKKLYQYAREDKDVEIKPREIEIYSIDNIKIDLESKEVAFDVACSKGTYIRSIANDIGVNLGCFGHLVKLIRTQAGKFLVENSVQLDDLDIKNKIQSPLEVLSLPQINVNDIMHERISHGMSIKTNTDKIKIGDFLILIYNNDSKSGGYG